MLKFSNTEAFWLTVAQAPLAFGAPRNIDLIDGPYQFAGMKKWFGKADLAGLIFCVAFSGQRQHAKRIVTAVKGHLNKLASTHDEFAVTVREDRWELSDGNTRALLYKALLLKHMGLLEGTIPVEYSYADLPAKVRVTFTETETAEQSLCVYAQYNSREAVKTTRDAVHTALKMTAAESGIELQSEFFKSEGAIATASEYAFFTGRAKPEIAVKLLQSLLPALDQMGLTRKAGLPSTLPGGAVAALAVLAAIDSVKALDFASALFNAEVNLLDEDISLPSLFARRVQMLKTAHQFSSAASLRPAVAELVGIVLAFASLDKDDTTFTVSNLFYEPVTVAELVSIAQARHPKLGAIFERRDVLMKKVKSAEPAPAGQLEIIEDSTVNLEPTAA